MSLKRHFLIFLVAANFAVPLSACATLQRGPVGNPNVPQPAKAVDLTRYAGLWYEIGRYENGFELGCEGVMAEYALRDDGLVNVLNTCRQNAVDGPLKTSQGKAKVVPGSDNAKLKVSFFGAFYLGDYWVLDRADDYSWSIVGEPSGRYLWLLSRDPQPDDQARVAIMERTKALGYDLSLIRQTRH
ncbi:lipocalin family protein [Brevundimonas diminuta]|uniref:lipocalin family protein n=1 Tax=Brevundimonas diminuta TaxID=293 RepID=UPI00320A1B42